MPDRRQFIGTLAAAGIGASVTPLAASATDISETLPVQQPTEKWDLTWLDKLNGKHKQVFDMGPLTGEFSPFLPIRNWYNAHRDVFGLDGSQISAIAGVHGSSFPANAIDAMWAKYPIGELWKINDPKTGKPATRNLFADPSPTSSGYDFSVPVLQKRGLTVWQCNNALLGVSAKIAAAAKAQASDVYKELRGGGLLAGVIVVPAHVMLIGLSQDHGFRYQAL